MAASRRADPLRAHDEGIVVQGRVLHPANPIFTGKDVGWGDFVQTPLVLFDREDAVFKMWFISDKAARNDEGRSVIHDQRLGHATSGAGLRWKVHPEPIYRSGRSPFVIKEAPGRYRMWMGFGPDLENVDGVFENIYAFHSTDGFHWTREQEPIIRPSGGLRSAVYISVLKEGDTWYLWHGGHVAGGRFEVFCATSKDGRTWLAMVKARFGEGRKAMDAAEPRGPFRDY